MKRPSSFQAPSSAKSEREDNDEAGRKAACQKAAGAVPAGRGGTERRVFKVVCVPGTSAARNLLQRGKRINERETSPTLFSASIDGRSDKLSDLRKSVASWLSLARINADGEAIVLATHEAAAGAIESGHQQFSVLGAIERDAVVISLRTDGPMRPLDLTEREERARLLNRLASSVRVEATANYSMLRLEFAASRG